MFIKYGELLYFIALPNKRGAYELIESYNLYEKILRIKENNEIAEVSA